MSEDKESSETLDLSQFVPRDYIPDVKTEDVIYGSDLQDGMIVLMEDDLYRVTVTEGMSGQLLKTALRENRWQRVTRVRENDGNISFMAVYEDGHKTARRTGKCTGWVVKKDSLPAPFSLGRLFAQSFVADLIENPKP